MVREAAALFALPFAWLWVRHQERSILRQGRALSPEQIADARKAGVATPERIRIRIVDDVPPGLPMVLGRFAARLGWPRRPTVGMSLRYGILIQAGSWGDRRILTHELAHTAQYERMGGIWRFLRRYLCECFTVGYCCSPMEDEAEQVARGICTGN